MKAIQQHLMAAVEKNKPYIAIVIIQFIYTGQSLFSKAAISGGMKPSVFVVYRQALATLVLAPFAFFFESKKTHNSLPFKVLCNMFLLALFGVALSLNLFYAGMNYVSATFATATTNTIPAMVFIMAICLRIERLNITQWSGIAKVFGSMIGLSGAMVFTFYKGPPIYHENGREINHSARVYTREEWIKGSILMLGANLTWSLWLIAQAPILKQYPAKLRFTTLQCCFSSLISMVYGAAVERNVSSWKLGWDANLFSLAYCGVVVTGLSYWLQVWVVHKEGPVFPAVFSPLALFLTAVFSAIIFKETLHWGSGLGAVLLVAGLYSFLWGKSTEAKNQLNEEKSNEETKEEVALEFITCNTANSNNNNEVGVGGEEK